ncbi:RNase P subunit RPR2 [Staphylococcus epidermidis]|nr:RNase P subunit RPR2 [Staphylococcus epidermidis]
MGDCIQDKLSSQFTSGLRVRLKCNACKNPVTRITHNIYKPHSKYNYRCFVYTMCEKCGERDVFIINEDFYGDISVDVKPLEGKWNL